MKKFLQVLFLLIVSCNQIFAQCTAVTHKQAFNFCGNGTFTVNGNSHTITSSGTYKDTLTGASANGCDSIVITIAQVSTPPTAVPQVSNFTLCNGDTSYAISLPLVDSNATFVKWSSSNPNIGLNSIGLGNFPSFRAINNGSAPVIDTIKAVVKGRGSAWIPANNIMYKYDIATQAIVDSALIPGNKTVTDIIFSPDGSKVYALDQNNFYQSSVNSVTFGYRWMYIFSAYDGTLLGQDTIVDDWSDNGNYQQKDNMCFSPDGMYLYIMSCSDESYWNINKYNTVTGQSSVYFVQNDTLATRINSSIGSYHCLQMCISPDGEKLYISSLLGVHEVNASTLTYSRLLDSANACLGLAITPDGKRLLVGSQTSKVSVIDIAADTLVTTIQLQLNNYVGIVRLSADSTRFIACTSNDGGQQGTEVVFCGEYDLKTFALLRHGNLGAFGCVPAYQATRAYTFNYFANLVSASFAPDGRDFYVHGAIDNLTPFTWFRFPAYGTNFPVSTPLGSQMPTNSLNQAGSTGQLVDGGHCASPVMSFTITVYPTARHTQPITICAGDTFNEGLHRYTTTGTYIDTFSNASMYGCDSIVTTVLTVIPYAKSFQTFSYCGSGSVTVGGTVHNTTGYYSDTLHAAATTGCDSIVFTNLLIYNLVPAPNVTVANITACPGTPIALNSLGTGSNGTSIVWNGTTSTIGLAANGVSTVPAFTAVNTGNTMVIDTISITSTSSGYAYVSNPNYSTVSVINRETNAIATTINGLSGASGIAVNMQGSRVYVTGQNVNQVSVINAQNNSVISTINVGTQPFNVAVSPAANRVYVANYGSSNVSTIDTVTNSVIATVTVGTNPYGLAVHPDGKRVYVANNGSNTISVINTLTNAVATTINGGNGPYGLAINNAGNRVYVVNISGNNVSVINADNDSLLTNITVGNSPRGIAVTPDGKRAFVPNFLDNTVSVIDAVNNVLLTTISVGSRPTGVSISADGTTAYVTNSVGGSVSVINISGNSVISTITGMPGPSCIGNFVSGSGCHSAAVNYTITVNPAPHYTQQINLCNGSTFTVGTHTYNTAGTFNDTLHNASVHGCDSLITTQITLVPAVTSTINTSICAGSSYAGHTAAGTYVDHYSNMYGCDSARTLNLSVTQNLTSTVTTSICQGASYAGHNATGTFVDHYTSAGGCDSVRTLHLTVIQPATYTITTSICSGSNYNGHTATGTYTDTYTGANGCDSVVTLHLTVNQPTSSSTNTTICQSALPYVWNGLTFNGAGSQTKAGLTNALGCDSTATLHLTVNPVSTSTTNASVCRAALPYTWNGLTFTNAGSQTKTGLTAANGCDSSATLNLTVNDTSHEDFNYSICASALPLSWNNLTITAPGTYTKTGLTNMYGCDSSITMHLTTRPGTSSTTNLTICQNQLPYTWNGLTFTGSGTQTKTGLQNSVFCDSTATLNLSVIPGNSITNITVCQSQLPYVWNGLNFNAAGTQTATGFTNVLGCDSTATLNLAVNLADTSVTNYTICSSALPYNWNGLTFNTAGAQTATGFTNAVGCDSAATLNLIVSDTSASITNASICQKDLPYTWNGLTFNAAGTQTITGLFTGLGCDSTATLNLSVTTIDSTISITGHVLTANQTGASYQWIDCNANAAISGANAASYTVTVTGDYAVALLQNNCADTSACVHVVVTGLSSVAPDEIEVYPNPNNGSFIIHGNNMEGMFVISNELGQNLMAFYLNAANNYTINVANFSSGIYFLNGRSNNLTITKKIVIAK